MEGLVNELALFAGAGGGILGGKLLGWTTVCAVEIDDYARRVLLHQQRQRNLPEFPIWDDICTFDGRPWRGLVDVVSGGFPCQDISAAGKGAGIEGSRSGLWAEMHRIVCEVRPRYVFVENSPMLTSRGLGRVLGDLAESGYDAEWMVLGAADVGAPHRRDRIWILAQDSQQRGLFSHPQHNRAGWGQQIATVSASASAALDTDTDVLQCTQQRLEHEGTEISVGCGADGVESGGDVVDAASVGRNAQQDEAEISGAAMGETPQRQLGRASGGEGDVADAAGERCEKQWSTGADDEEHSTAERCSWWRFEPKLGRVAHGVAHRVDRLRCLGNGQVPFVAATAFREMMKRFN